MKTPHRKQICKQKNNNKTTHTTFCSSALSEEQRQVEVSLETIDKSHPERERAAKEADVENLCIL